MLPKNYFMMKVAFFQTDQLGIGPIWRNLEDIGQKWILELLLSEI